MPRKSSNHFAKPTPDSEEHNSREIKPSYLLDVKEENIVIINQTMKQRLPEIKKIYEEKVKQKWQEKSEPFRESVINLDIDCFRNEDGKLTSNEGIRRIKLLNKELKETFGITAFQIYVHLDEGKASDIPRLDTNNKISFSKKPLPLKERNLHAHIIYDFQNKETGKIVKLQKKDMHLIQTITANCLGMTRGKMFSKTERLEHGEYRTAKKILNDEIKNLAQEQVALQQAIEEKKKNIQFWKQKNNDLFLSMKT